ncbi:MAG: NAD(P)-dependent glycerol-3-phosphate dehydrogenase [Desulfobulbaceae bacterium]|nr:MAG: NAD(P)-dependent glycerol-3-phosphate dehydrogenase [Desulfobulbaceae bacterium]
MSKSKQIAVVGAGSWGTALALALSRKGHQVSLWDYDSDHIQTLAGARVNNRYLPDHPFPDTLVPEKSLKVCVQNKQIILMVVPTHGFRSVFEQIANVLETRVAIVSASKGVENETLLTMSQIMTEIVTSYGKQETVELAVLSGPSFAKEVANQTPTAVTIGCKDSETACDLQETFNTQSLRVYSSSDLIGLEISAALKNIVAIAAGICDGLRYGTNTRAALITRGLAEIARFGIHFGAETETFYGLSGMGDLVLTCTGDLSRNRTVGLKLGQGKGLEQILEEMSMVAEGVKTTKSVYDLSQKLSIEMPITEQVYEILYKGKNCSLAVKDLLSRELKPE